MSGAQVCDDRIQIKRFEFFCVIKVVAHRVRLRRVLVQNLEVQLLWPPMLVRGSPFCRVSVTHYRAFTNAVAVHFDLQFMLILPDASPAN